jgi:hypothetical protein
VGGVADDVTDQVLRVRRGEAGWCATMEVHRRLLNTLPGYADARRSVEDFTFDHTQPPDLRRRPLVRIPVVAHVLWHDESQNIPDAQVTSQIAVLNRDFRALNPDVAGVPDVWQPLVADARIEFELATTDPSGAPASGITRTWTPVAAFDADDAMKSVATGGVDAWPTDSYLNLWICQLGGGLLGYAQFPGGPPATDGVVVLHAGFGAEGTATAPFNLGRTATHEVGHWLNLRHIWGDDGDGCNGQDFVDDTPNQGGPNYGAPRSIRSSCDNGPHGDMYMNYMDYTDYAAMFMFTVGQAQRMDACLADARATFLPPPEPELPPPADC